MRVISYPYLISDKVFRKRDHSCRYLVPGWWWTHVPAISYHRIRLAHYNISLSSLCSLYASYKFPHLIGNMGHQPIVKLGHGTMIWYLPYVLMYSFAIFAAELICQSPAWHSLFNVWILYSGGSFLLLLFTNESISGYNRHPALF